MGDFVGKGSGRAECRSERRPGGSGNCKMLVLGFIEEHDWGEKNKTGLLGTYAG